ncbi:MAG TPA: FAD-dependent oxidoreductase [Ktedonobacterales bacterium]
MSSDSGTVIIGAGPYGLSVAAHLREQGIPIRVFGKPMEFWKSMPSGMYLKSVWSATTLSDPHGNYSLNRYIATANLPRQEPIPLPLFLNYAQWFQQHAVPDIEPTDVQTVARDGKRFRIELADGNTVKADHIIVAIGISSFTQIPAFARDLPPSCASHTQDANDFTRFSERRVVVVGSGQSGLEHAALLHEAGADVEVIARGPINWIDRRLYDRTGPAKRIFYPPSDVGPPGINWLCALPLFFSRLPEKARAKAATRALRPAGAQWLRPRVEGRVRLTAHTQISRATTQDGGVRLELTDGTVREVDYLFLGTGYRPDVQKLAFIDPALLAKLEVRLGYPVQTDWFESSIPGLHFVGALAGYNFGPICRFVTGAGVAGRQIRRHLADCR